MARRFVRVDLAEAARDFRPIAVEPGVPLLDRGGSNAKIIFRWLGGLAAEPVWEAEAVSFYVRDDHGGRLEEVVCQPATRDDLHGTLKDDLETLKQRIERARPETSTERALHRAVRRSFEALVEDPNRTDVDDYFFRYRDVQGRWRLVWCWGYQRVDQEPAPAVICTDPDCNLLFVRRPGQSPKCPGCEAALATRPVRRLAWKRVAALCLLMLILGALVALWWLSPERLVATPATWQGPPGSRVQFQVMRSRWLGLRQEDVSQQAVPIVLDPRVARIDPLAGAAVAFSPGTTLVRFHLGSLSADATLVVSPAAKLKGISIEPRDVELAVGTTARLKLIGQLEDGSKVDLTEAAEWTPQNDGIVFAANGLLEGLGEGHATVFARYRPSPDDRYLEATADVNVVRAELQALELAIEPLPVGVGRASRLRIEAVAKDGTRYSVVESSRLETNVAPSDLARLEGGQLLGLRAGEGKLAARFDDRLTAGAAFQVAFGPGLDRLVVHPERLELVVGELAELSIASPSAAPIKLASSDAKIVEVTAENRLLGRGPGEARIDVRQENQSAEVEVSVRRAEFRSLAIEPASVVVPVDHTVRPRVMAAIEESGDPKQGKRMRQVELAPAMVSVVEKPSARFAEFDAATLHLRGVEPTPANAPQRLAVRFGQLEAAAPVAVVVAPFRLRLEPPGPVEVPLGQQVALKGIAIYSGGQRVEVPPQRMKWSSDPAAQQTPGLELRGNRVAALQASAGPLPVWASYFGTDSNRVEFRSGAADPQVQLRLALEPAQPQVGQTGIARLEAVGPKGPVELVAELASFSSSRPDVLAVDKTSGGFRAQTPGHVELGASHPGARQGASLEVDVTGAVGEDVPVAVKILSDQGPSVRFPVGAEFDDFRVEARYADGFTRLVTAKATLRTPEPPDSAPVAFDGGRIRGLRPGKTMVSAEFQGVRCEERLAVEVLGQVDVDEIRLSPALVVILPGETVAMDAIGYKDGKSVGILTGLPELVWRSSNPQVAALSGSAVTGFSPGAASVMASLGSGPSAVQSQPAEVRVESSIADGLRIEPESLRQGLRMRVGESVRIGTDLNVFRGPMDVSRLCTVTSSLPGIVRYEPESHSLVGVRSGASMVALAAGDKVANLLVEVLPSGQISGGQVVVEPAAGTLIPGAALPLRVFLVGPAGERIDRTSSAVLASTDPNRLRILGNLACALAPGTVEVNATLPETANTGSARITINDETIAALLVEPAQLELPVGSGARLRILGQAPSGTYELFAQPDLTLSSSGPQPDAVRIAGGNEVVGVVPGQAVVDVEWQGRLGAQVPVSVFEPVLAGLQIEPAQQTVAPGATVVYQVTALRGGRRVVLGVEDGLELHTTDPEVACPIGPNAVRAQRPGRSMVVARVGPEQAEATLNVTTGPAATDVVFGAPGGATVVYRPRTHIVDPDRWYEVYGPGGRWYSADPRGRWYRGGPGRIVERVPGGAVELPPAEVVGLRFLPDVLRLDVGGPGAYVRVFELLADGSLGREVTRDPNLEVTESPLPNVVVAEKTAQGPFFRPTGRGEARLGARLGGLTADPLLVSVGEAYAAGMALEVAPNPLVVWAGELGSLGAVRINPGGGRMPFETDYRLVAAPNQGIVAVEGAEQKMVRGLAVGNSVVTVQAIDPGGTYEGLSTAVQVRVISPQKVWIEPAEITLEPGQLSAPVSVMVEGADGLAYPVPAAVESMDPAVVVPDPAGSRCFLAKAAGQTKLRAEYHGREVFADVSVIGQRFLAVHVGETPESHETYFHVSLSVTAAESEGPLEYRVYVAGEQPGGQWVPAELQDGLWRLTLRSPPIPYKPRGALYQLVIEARSRENGSVQQYPLTFELGERVQRMPAGVAPGRGSGF